MIKKVKFVWKTEGIQGILRSIYQKIFHPKLKIFDEFSYAFDNKYGLEIGGPSSIFWRNGQFPVYKIAKGVENCNFSFNTIWEGTITPSRTFHYDKKHEPGWQYIGEATDLDFIPQNKRYDFLLSFHVLEHIANPIKALKKWNQLLAPQGTMALGLPLKEKTFDRYRKATPLSHLIKDYDMDVSEDDQTHFEDVLLHHDFSLVSEQMNADKREFARMVKENYNFRVVHHHVFNKELVIDLLDFLGVQILAVEVFPPWHILALAQKNPGLE